jgi:hypothetical protein
MTVNHQLVGLVVGREITAENHPFYNLDYSAIEGRRIKVGYSKTKDAEQRERKYKLCQAVQLHRAAC